MIITTTPSIEGKKITTYHGLATGEAIVGANIFKDIFASITDIVGGRSGAYEKELAAARKMAEEELITAAHEMGGNAVVGVDIDYEVISRQSSALLMVSISGTAVTTT